MEYEYSTTDPAAVAAIMAPIYLISLLLGVIMIVALWKIFTKAGEPGWAAIVPFYNAYTEFKIAGMNPWLFLLMFIPFVNIVMAILVSIKLGERFGKSVGWSIVLLVLFSFVGLLILGFGKDRYTPPPAVAYGAPTGYAPPPPPPPAPMQ